MVESRRSYITSRIVFHTVLAFFALLCVIPIISVVSISFSSGTSLHLEGFTLLPKNVDLTAYRYIFKKPYQLINAYIISIEVTVLGTVIGVSLMALLAYPLSRRDFRLGGIITFIVFFTMLFRGGLVPTYILVTRILRLRNTIWAQILPLLVTGWHVFLLRTYFKTVPFELIEASKIEGASEFRIFIKVIAPLTKPGIATVSLLLCLGYWNSWFPALLYIDDSTKVPLQFWMMRVMDNINFLLSLDTISVDFGLEDIPTESARMAMAVLAAGPMLFIFPFFQKYFARGIRIGAIKG
ncbi:MAG: carbohydrate ABC transporter permease [Spirochaetia bacterium]